MIREDFCLQRYNTFGLPARAERYLRLTELEQLAELAPTAAPKLVLGGGSNLLLLDRVMGLTLHPDLQGVYEIRNNEEQTPAAHYPAGRPTVLRAYAGVNWQQFVLYSIRLGLHGLENLALIPGSVGAAPVQNIGAYGVEVSERITAVHAWKYGVGFVSLTPEECAFDYRDSLFKREPGRYLITAVDFRLGGPFVARTEYGALAERLGRLFGAVSPTPARVARAVMEIRAEKLPFFSQAGNSGSFFKNPVIERNDYEDLLTNYPYLPAYPAGPDHVKVPAGWLIDRAGWRGRRWGAVGCWPRQALVLVNYGGATGREVLAFSEEIQREVLDRYGITLEREVRVVGQNHPPPP